MRTGVSRVRKGKERSEDRSREVNSEERRSIKHCHGNTIHFQHPKIWLSFLSLVRVARVSL